MNDRQGIDRRDSVQWAAGVALARLDSVVGAPGRTATATRPALLARIDQHAAEVRDALSHDDGAAVVALAAYADGVLDVAAARGVDPLAAASAGRWDAPSWALLRLLAVCQLAENAESAG